MIVTATSAVLSSLLVPEGKRRLEICDAVIRGLILEKTASEKSVPHFLPSLQTQRPDLL